MYSADFITSKNLLSQRHREPQQQKKGKISRQVIKAHKKQTVHLNRVFYDLSFSAPLRPCAKTVFTVRSFYELSAMSFQPSGSPALPTFRSSYLLAVSDLCRSPYAFIKPTPTSTLVTLAHFRAL
jgi:hypothetical protein